jgi:hypothetical protein
MYRRSAAHPRAWDASKVAGAHAFDRPPRWLGRDNHGREQQPPSEQCRQARGDRGEHDQQSSCGTHGLAETEARAASDPARLPRDQKR